MRSTSSCGVKKLPLSLRAYGFGRIVISPFHILSGLVLQKPFIDGSELLDRHVAVVDEARLSIIAFGVTQRCR